MSREADHDALDASTRLSVHRTDLAMENTIMGADRTQMAVLRSSLSLIGFGFTIYKFFQEVGNEAAHRGVFGAPARNLGLLLVTLGIFLLVAGLFNRHRLVRTTNERRQSLYDEGLSMMPPTHKTSPNMIASVLLLIGGLLVILGIVARTGPFG